jgi:hypothetical protein
VTFPVREMITARMDRSTASRFPLVDSTFSV